jgi:hypothetical protein
MSSVNKDNPINLASSMAISWQYFLIRSATSRKWQSSHIISFSGLSTILSRWIELSIAISGIWSYLNRWLYSLGDFVKLFGKNWEEQLHEIGIH